MTTAAVIVAAGRGTRAGSGLPKQWREISGQSVASRTIGTFRRSGRIDLVMVVLHPDDMDRADSFRDDPAILVTPGGETRDASVRCGLEALEKHKVDRVLIHDVARPLVSEDLIARVADALDFSDGAAPALAVSDALWSGEAGRVAGAVDRTGLFRAQTPQGFRFDAILAAHRTFEGTAADDVEVARAAGLEVVIVPGEERNLKITSPEDFARAERLLRETMDVRTGSGFDVHRFSAGDHVILCGVRIPHDRALSGHSDADVGMHAVTDAIYGALAEGDIGRHFPPSDPKWKGADSRVFLEHAVALAAERGYRISNTDCTLICEHPKIGPHAADMQRAMAEIMNIEPDRVSIKATTSERLGFTGRSEGIAAMATATLVSP